MNVPPCYGNLHSNDTEECQCCLLNPQCLAAMDRPKLAIGEKADLGPIPKEKKLLILAVCRKFGIPTVYVPKGQKEEFQVTEENIKDFHNLDFLLTSVTSLEHLFRIELK